MSIYRRNGEIHIPEDSREWHDIQAYVKSRIAELDEQKNSIENKRSEWLRILEPETKKAETAVKEEKAEVIETVVNSKTERVYSAPDAMLKLGISPSTLTTACKSGRIPHAKDEKGRWCFSETDLDAIRTMVAKGELCPAKSVPDGFLGTGEVCMTLGVTEHELRELRQRGYITTENRTKQGTPCCYSPEKVDDLAVLFRKKGGARNFIEEVTHERLY